MSYRTSLRVRSMHFSNIEDVRKQIDRIDSELIRIITQRAKCVKAAARFKTDRSAVRAPDRVQQVIDKDVLHSERFEYDCLS